MRLCMIGCRWFLDDAPPRPDVSMVDLMTTAGGNTGNFFIGEAVRAHLRRHFKNIEAMDYYSLNDIKALNGKDVGEQYDYIVMAASNVLRRGIDIGFLAMFLEQSRLPFIVLGLGAQAEHGEDSIALTKGTARVFAYAAANSKGIGVRGEFTADVLRKNGIGNIEVLGCPTAYIRAGENFRITVPKSVKDVEHCAVSYKRDRNLYETDKMLVGIQRAMFQQSLERGFDCVAQTEFAESTIAFYRQLDNAAVNRLARYYDLPSSRRDELEHYALAHFHVFFRYREWREFLARQDFAFGGRYHGNLMALTSGVPAVWFVHDTRTEELCAHHKLPAIRVRDLAETGYSLERILDAADYSEFNRGYDESCARFDRFLLSHFTSQPAGASVPA